MLETPAVFGAHVETPLILTGNFQISTCCGSSVECPVIFFFARAATATVGELLVAVCKFSHDRVDFCRVITPISIGFSVLCKCLSESLELEF